MPVALKSRPLQLSAQYSSDPSHGSQERGQMLNQRVRKGHWFVDGELLFRQDAVLKADQEIRGRTHLTGQQAGGTALTLTRD